MPTLVTPTRVERSVPLKCLVSQINYNLFDLEVGTQQSQFAYLQAKDLADSVEGLMRTHDVALWNGNDTSLSAPTTPQYYGAARQINDGGNVLTIHTTDSIVDGLKSTVAQMVANSSYEVRPTAIYANPVLLDLIDREMKAEFNVVLSSTEVAAGLRVKTLSTQAGELPLIPEWSIPYTGIPGSGSAVLPCYIVTRRHDRVPLADRSESARVPVGHAELAGFADGGGEVWRRRGEGRQLRALQGDREPVVQGGVTQRTHVSQVAVNPCSDAAEASLPFFDFTRALTARPQPGAARSGKADSARTKVRVG